MHLKIYFGNKPLFLSDTKTEEIERYLQAGKTAFVSQSDAQAIKNIIGQLQEPQTLAAVLLQEDVHALFSAFSREFTIIQAAGGLVYSADQQILLIFRRGKWDLPKGKLDEGEDLQECALREVQEETGIMNITLEKSLCITYHTYYEGNKHILKESHWYLMQTDHSQVLTPQLEEDIEKCEWVKAKDITPYLDNTFPAIIDVLNEALTTLHLKKQI